MLACLFFVLDFLVPLGVADAVLYSAVVFLSAASRYAVTGRDRNRLFAADIYCRTLQSPCAGSSRLV